MWDQGLTGAWRKPAKDGLFSRSGTAKFHYRTQGVAVVAEWRKMALINIIFTSPTTVHHRAYISGNGGDEQNEEPQFTPFPFIALSRVIVEKNRPIQVVGFGFMGSFLLIDRYHTLDEPAGNYVYV